MDFIILSAQFLYGFHYHYRMIPFKIGGTEEQRQLLLSGAFGEREQLRAMSFQLGEIFAPKFGPLRAVLMEPNSQFR